jgi:dienelactone hydrolase
MAETLAFRLEGRGGALPIFGDVRLPSGEGAAPVVAIAHDWLRWKDWGFLPYLAGALAAAGNVAVSFSFSGSGVPPGGDEIADEDAFARNTFTREVEDLERVATAIFERILPGRERFDIRRIGALGHGTGGSIALIEAARDTRVKAVIAIGAPAALDSVLPPGAMDSYFARGEHRFRDPRTNRPLRLAAPFFRDLRARRKDLDVAAAAEALAAPFLLVHGSDDERAPLAGARSLFFANAERADLEILRGADHDLGATHPLESPGDALRAACEAVVRFFRARLCA